MSGDGGRQGCERVEVLELTGSHNRQQTFDGALTLVASRPKHDLAPLDGRSERYLGGIVRGLDALLVHEGKEVLIVHEERVGQIAHVGVRRVEIPFAEGKEPLLNRQDFGDKFRTGERRSSGGRIAAEAMPEAKDAAVEREGLAAEAFRGRRGGEVERTEQVPTDVGPAQLSLADDVFQI